MRPGGSPPTVDALLALAGDQLAEALDAKHGAEVTDQSIYRAHAAKYEVRGAAADRSRRSDHRRSHFWGEGRLVAVDASQSVGEAPPPHPLTPSLTPHPPPPKPPSASSSRTWTRWACGAPT
jgi:hypothetical protein